jgi:hypothetical protein
VRLGLRLTGRQNGDKPVGSQTEGEPAVGQDVDQPAPDQAETAVGEVVSDDTRTEGEPAPAHAVYPAVGSEAEVLAAASRYESPPAGAQAQDGAAGTEAEVPPPGSGAGPGDGGAGPGDETGPDDETGPGGGSGPGDGTVSDTAVAEAAPSEAAAEPAATRTAVTGKTARRWDLGLGPAIGGLWQRSVVPAWQRSIGRLGISRLWQPSPGVRESASPGVRALALVTAMPVILLVAWLVPGVVLLLTHRFLPAPMVLISVPLAVALSILVARELPGRWPALDATRTRQPSGTKDAKPRDRAWPAWWGLGGTIVIAGVFAAWQLMENSAQLIVSRDPGAYAQFAYWIAEHGSLPIPASAAAFGGAHPGLTFASFGFASHNGAVAPGLTAGLPIVLALGAWVHGVTGAAVISPLLGALGIVAVGGLTARLAGPQWAPAGALLLALTVPEIYTSRSAFSATLAQALLFGGLCLVVDSLFSRRRITLAGLGGLALGLTVLAGTGFLLMLLPLIVVAGALLAGRRPQAIPLTAGLLVGVIGGLTAGIALDDPALSTTTPSLGIIGVIAGGLAVVTAVGVAIGLVGSARRRARKLLGARPLCWLPEIGAILVVAAAIGLAIRPYVQKVHGPANPYIAALQRLQDLPIEPGRLYAENTLSWVIWYLGVPALLLGFVGLAMVTRLCLRALITWRDPTGVARAWVVPVAIIGWGVFAVLWQPFTVPDQPWASRQLVPVVLPGLIVLAVWVAAWMIGRAHARGARTGAVATATACFVIAMAVPAAAITFGIALSQPADPATRLALSGLAFRTTSAGEVAAVEQLCGALPSRSSVVILDKAAARAFAQVVRGTCDLPTAIVTSTAPGEVGTIIGGIERAGRHPVLLATKEAELTPYGAAPR